MRHGRFIRPQIIQLMLGKKAGLELRRRADQPVFGLKPSGNELGEGRLAVAVRAKQRDPVVGVDPQIKP
jgi:hypothetical protein